MVTFAVLHAIALDETFQKSNVSEVATRFMIIAGDFSRFRDQTACGRSGPATLVSLLSASAGLIGMEIKQRNGKLM